MTRTTRKQRLILVRHGETEWNRARCLQGQTDITLSETGRAQARALAPLVATLNVDGAVTSDLARAAETAALIGWPAATQLPTLREQALGDWEGRAIADLLATEPAAYHGWRAGQHNPPGGEDWQAFRTRVAQALRAALEETGGTLLATCHGGVIRAALDALIGLPPARILPVGPASLTILIAEGTGFRLEAYNLSPGRITLLAPD